MIIHSHKEIQILRQAIALNASKTFLEIKNLLGDLDPISFFARLKFEKIGADPIAGTAMNTIEQRAVWNSGHSLMKSSMQRVNLSIKERQPPTIGTMWRLDPLKPVFLSTL